MVALALIHGQNMIPENEHELFDGQKKKILIYFIGGVTYAEIGAIRYLNQLKTNMQFIIATTQIITGTRAMSQLRTSPVTLLDPMSMLFK